MRRVMQLWDWLPAFRAIAETEHLTNAAHQLHVTPPALSRTLKILEEDLGRPLFDREGRNLVLNPAGRRLLSSVRSAMRLVHDAIEEIEGERSAPLIIASSGIFTVVGLHETLVSLRDSHPHVRPDVRTVISDDPSADLLQGRLDLLFTSAPLFREGLSTVSLLASPMAVFCGPGHPLHGRADVDLGALADHPFAAPPRDPSGNPIDGWPGDWPRIVAVTADRQSLGLTLCLTGRLLAVFPEVVARAYPELWRVPVTLPGEVVISAVHRRTIGDPAAIEAAVEHAARIFRG